VEQRRHEAPQFEERHDKEEGDNEERPEQSLPDALGKKGEPAQAHLALEAALKRTVLGPLAGGLGLSKSHQRNS